MDHNACSMIALREDLSARGEKGQQATVVDARLHDDTRLGETNNGVPSGTSSIAGDRVGIVSPLAALHHMFGKCPIVQ